MQRSNLGIGISSSEVEIVVLQGVVTKFPFVTGILHQDLQLINFQLTGYIDGAQEFFVGRFERTVIYRT